MLLPLTFLVVMFGWGTGSPLSDLKQRALRKEVLMSMAEHLAEMATGRRRGFGLGFAPTDGQTTAFQDQFVEASFCSSLGGLAHGERHEGAALTGQNGDTSDFAVLIEVVPKIFFPEDTVTHVPHVERRDALVLRKFQCGKGCSTPQQLLSYWVVDSIVSVLEVLVRQRVFWVCRLLMATLFLNLEELAKVFDDHREDECCAPSIRAILGALLSTDQDIPSTHSPSSRSPDI
ncbi:unnamed protein product [Cyprideis torosa]|uniref:Uncharacterized protein n=1 Tax=Cyprideis torosa TaxID=163714 RepID=A0A7R8W7U3_9CRUS|nr:unnamed protein product [Cyprideis torosa]CAG0887948.1 unnamed protein product [Cyprideis torosa]